MDEFLKMDIFFFVAAVCTAILSILLAMTLVYAISLLRDLKYISNKAKTEVTHLSQDINNLRQNVSEKGFQLMPIINFLTSIIKRKRKK